MKFFSYLLLFTMVFTYTSPVYAQDATGSTPSATTAPNSMKNTRLDAKNAAAEARNQLKQQKMEMKDTLMEKREEMKEKIQERKEALKLQLQKIKDEKKQMVVERINDKIATFSAKHTERWGDVLDRMQSQLDDLKAETEQAKTSGMDVTKVEANIIAAQNAIDAASTAVTSQAGKTYTITISNEARLRADVGNTVSLFRSDMLAVQKKVMDAHKAVVVVKTSLNESQNSEDSSDATESAGQSN